MGSAPSRRGKAAAQARPTEHPGDTVGWSAEPSAELRDAAGGCVQVLSSTLGWTWAALVEADDDRIVVQYGERTRVLQWETPSSTAPESLEWMDVLRNPMPLGSLMQTFSESLDEWVPATVVRAHAQEIVVQYGDRAKVVRLGDPEEPASAVLRRPTEEAVLLVARNREHMELRLKCDLIKAWLLAPEEAETLDSNLEQLDLLSKEYEEKRAELTAQQRDMVEAEITRMRRICCPDKLLAAAEAKRDAHEAAEAERRKLEKKKQSGSIFASGFADRGIIRSVQSTA